MCTIVANIWGTRFKFYGHSNYLPDILGSVNYKVSLLHLQPRQMTVSVTTNDCIQKQIQSFNNNKMKKLINPTNRKNKQLIHSKIDEDNNNKTLIG